MIVFMAGIIAPVSDKDKRRVNLCERFFMVRLSLGAKSAKTPMKTGFLALKKKLLGPLDNGARKQYISGVLRGMCPADATKEDVT